MGVVNLPHLPVGELKLTKDQHGRVLRLSVLVEEHEVAQLPITGLTREDKVGDHPRLSVHMFQHHLKEETF